MTGPRTRAEKLAAAGAVAPVIRQRAGSGRKVTLIDAEGKPIRETTDVEVAMGLLRRADIDFSVQPGIRPKERPCHFCGKIYQLPKDGPIPTVAICFDCRGGLDLTCDRCGRSWTRKHAPAKPRPRLCKGCNGANNFVAMTPETRVKALVKAAAGRRGKLTKENIMAAASAGGNARKRHFLTADTITNDVRAHLRSTIETSVGAAVTACGGSRSAIRAALRRLSQSGEAIRVERGRYRLAPQAGRSA